MSADEAIVELSSMLNTLCTEAEATPEDQAANIKGFIKELLPRKGVPTDLKLESNEEGRCGVYVTV